MPMAWTIMRLASRTILGLFGFSRETPHRSITALGRGHEKTDLGATSFEHALGAYEPRESDIAATDWEFLRPSSWKALRRLSSCHPRSTEVGGP